ncbi:MAG: DUF1592 domain-containing protein [Planctomycetes bacterium]|nr:DUF1592 domain-containing protein [Planctomycetota bacterium]
MPAVVPSLALPQLAFAALLIAAGAMAAGGGASPAAEPADLVKTFCQECHAGDRVEGDVDLTGLTPEAMRRDVATWQRATEMVVTGQMPPREAAQPSAEERTALAAWLGGFLRAEARAHAGDPGRVVLRRLNNAEYTFAIRDLTGLESLEPAREFPADSGAGEGFTNTGQTLAMSPALFEKYLAAAKEVADHAVLLPDGIGFSTGTTHRDVTDELLARIRAIYRTFTVALEATGRGGQTTVEQGIELDMGREGFLPVGDYLRALLEERTRLAADPAAVAAVAAERGLSAKYLGILFRALSAPAPADSAAPLDDLRRALATATPADAPRLAERVRQWQGALWRFNKVGQIGRRLGRPDGPETWLEARSPLVARQEFRVRLPDRADGAAVAVAFDAGDLGAGAGGAAGDVVVWERPRLVAPGRGDVALADVGRLATALAGWRQELASSAAASLAAADELRQATGAPPALEALAARRGVDPLLLAGWLGALGIGAGPVDFDLLATPERGIGGWEAVRGFVAADALSVVANSSDQSVQIPGTLGAHGVAVHPAPTKRVIVAWRSPVAGAVTVSSVVTRAHVGCGNGTTWSLEVRRGGVRQTLASGFADEPKPKTAGPLAGVAVQPGDAICLVVGPRDGSHVCDLTAVDLTIAHGDETWHLAGEVSPDILAGNPHADGRGRAGVWHFAHEPDQPTGALAIPPGSVLDRWLTAPAGAERAAAAAELARLLAAAQAGQLPDGPDGALVRLVLSPSGPVLAPRFRAWLAAPAPAGAGAFGHHPNGLAVGPADLCVAAPGRFTVEIPADLAAGSELVTAAALHPQAPPTACVEPALHVGGAAAGEPGLRAGAAVIAAPGSPAARRIEEGFAAFRELFPTAPCYVRIVPVDEVVTLNVFFREDDHLRRLLLDAEQTARLDRAWEELLYVSREPLELRDALEQLIEYATQDNPAGVQSFTPMRPHVVARAEEFARHLVATEPAHVDAVVARAGRAFRRPLTAAEEERLRGLYRRLRAESHSHEEAIRLTLASVLVAPEFLYRLEAPGAGSAASPVTPYELATRLSLFLWSSLPDDELLALAASGALADDAVLVAQTRRMRADPRARRLAEEFGTQWLHVHGFAGHDEKSAEAFPTFHPLRAAMAEETVLFLDDLFRHDRSIQSLVDADHTFLNAALAAHYGIPGVEGDHWRRVDGVRAFGRGGILGLATTLATQSGASRTSPILRGNWLSEVILGEKLPKPPKNVPLLADAVPAGLSERELVALHSADESCATCHRRIDPYGFALEGFDAIGRRRTADAAGHPIDDRTTLPDGTDVAGVEGLRGWLAGKRAADVERQFCRKLLGYALGRGVQLSDEPLLDTIQERLATADHRVGTAIEAIVTSPQFRSIRGRDAAD